MPLLAIGIDARPATAGAQEFERARQSVKKSAKEAADAVKDLSAAEKEAGAATKKAGEDMRSAERDAAGFGKASKDAAGGARALGEESARASKSVREGGDAAKAAEKSTRDLGVAEDKAGRSAADFGRETKKALDGIKSSSLVDTNREISSMVERFAALRPGAGGISKELQSVAVSAGISAGAFTVLADTALKGLGSIRSGLEFVVDKSLAFDRSLEVVNSRLKGSDLGQYRDQLRDLSGAFRFSLEELGQGAGQSLTSGFGTAGSSIQFLSEAARAARANVVPLSDGIRILDDNLDAYGLGARKAREVTDKLTVGARIGETNFSSFGAAVAQAGTRLAPLGVEMDEIIAVLAQITARGVPAQEAVTGLSSAILKASDPTDLLAKKLRSMGIVADAEAIRVKGLINVLGDIQSAIGDNPAKLAELFGSPRTASAVFAAVKDGATGAAAALAKLKDSAGAADGAIDGLGRSAAVKLDILKKLFDAKATELGDSFVENFVEAVEKGRITGAIVGFLTRSDIAGLAAGALQAGPIKPPKVDVPADLGSDVVNQYLDSIRDALVDGDQVLAEGLIKSFREAQKKAANGLSPEYLRESFAGILKLQAEQPKEFAKNAEGWTRRAKEIALGMTDVDTSVRQVINSLGGLRIETEEGAKSLKGLVGDALELKPVKIKLDFTVDEAAAEREAQVALSRLQKVTTELPDRVGKAQQTLTAVKGNPYLVSDPVEKEKFSDALKSANEFLDAVAKAKQIQVQLSAQVDAGLEREAAGYRASEKAFEDLIALTEELSGKEATAGARAELERVKAANATHLQLLLDQKRAQSAQALYALEAQAAEKRLALGRDPRDEQLRVRLGLLDREAQVSESTIRATLALQGESADAIERQVAAMRARVDAEKQSLVLANEDADRQQAIALAKRAAAKFVAGEADIADRKRDQTAGEQKYLEILGQVSNEYSDQRAVLDGLRAIERDRLAEQTKSSEIQKEILALYDRQTEKLRAQQLVTASDRRREPYNRDDAEIAEGIYTELKLAGTAVDEFDEKFDRLLQQRRALREITLAGVGGLRGELNEAAQGYQDLGQAALDTVRSIKDAAFDQLVAQPISEFFGKGLASFTGGLGLGKGPEPEDSGIAVFKQAIDPATASLGAFTLAVNSATTAVGSQGAASSISGLLGGFGGGGDTGGFEQGFGGGQQSALGNVFRGRELVPFAKGGAVSDYSNNGFFDRPTLFPMANGAAGIAGEAGTEAIFPLKRGGDGKLGVAASGVGQQIVNNTTVRMTVNTPDADSFRRSDRQIQQNLRRFARGR